MTKEIRIDVTEKAREIANKAWRRVGAPDRKSYLSRLIELASKDKNLSEALKKHFAK